jgi:HK97 family phage portal protein
VRMADTDLAPIPSFFGRLRARVEGYVRQLLSPADVNVWGGGIATNQAPRYDLRTAMSSLAAFPWVRAAVRARCDDVGGLPVRARRVGSDDFEARDPFLDLLKRPSPGVTQTVFLRQLEADLSICGNAYVWLYRGPDGVEMHRLHPSHVRANIADGRLVSWTYGTQEISRLDVYHIRDISWSDDLSAIFGASAIQTLHDGLTASQASRRHAASTAKKGRPDVILTVDSQGAGANASRDVGEGYEQNALSGRRAFVVNRGVDVKPVTWSPRDLEMAELDTRVRDETLAVLRVPPSRVGIQAANYAAQRSEMQEYWLGLLVSDLQLFADAFTAIAHDVGSDLSVEITFDTSQIPALQTSYDQRQARAGFWVQVMGADPAAAAEYEGFKGAPVGEVDRSAQAPKVTPKGAKVEDPGLSKQALLERSLSMWLSQAADRLQGQVGDHKSEGQRLASVLSLVGCPQAESLGAEIGAIVCEAAATCRPDQELGELYLFSPAYARSVAQRACPVERLAAK